MVTLDHHRDCNASWGRCEYVQQIFSWKLEESSWYVASEKKSRDHKRRRDSSSVNHEHLYKISCQTLLRFVYTGGSSALFFQFVSNPSDVIDTLLIKLLSTQVAFWSHVSIMATQSLFLHFFGYFFLFYTRNHSSCVSGSECYQNVSDLHAALCLNASCEDTGRGLKLLLLLC